MNPLNNASITSALNELENHFIDFYEKNPLLSKNISITINSYFRHILAVTCDNFEYIEDLKIKNCSMISHALINDDYTTAISLAKQLDGNNSYSFNLEQMLTTLNYFHGMLSEPEGLDPAIISPLNTLYNNIQNHIYDIILAIKHSKEVPPKINKLNGYENYLSVLKEINQQVFFEKINMSSSHKYQEFINNIIIDLLNASYKSNNNKEANTIISEFLIYVLNAKYYSTAIKLAEKLDANNSFSFNLKQLITALEYLNTKLNQDGLDEDLKTTLSKLNHDLETKIQEIIFAIKNSDDIQPKIDNLKTYAQKVNSNNINYYPPQDKHHRLINTIIVNVLIAIGCLGIGFPLALGLHYWKTGRVFFKEYTKKEKEFDIEAKKVTQKISSDLLGKKQI
jgi:hypothetical protein